MYMDPVIPHLVAMALVILCVGIVLRRLRQPHVVAYILAGVLIGPFGLGLITHEETIARFGEFGVLLLIFFVGMELPIKDLVRQWRAPVIGTSLEVIISVACVVPIGLALDWSLKRIVFLGFVISLSSTAVIINILREGGVDKQPIGRDVIAINIAQDLAVVPMLIILSLLVGNALNPFELSLQTIGGIGVIALFAFIARRGTISLPFERFIRKDPEMQVFAALFICFGLALVTGLLHLSAALGAFLAGAVLSTARQSDWVKQQIEPFRVVFVGVFFLSIGMILDFAFVREHIITVSLLVAVVLATNTGINAVALRTVGHDWPTSVYGGGLLAHIGEFSFVLAAIGLQNDIITEFSYQVTIAMICFSMLLSPAWIGLIRRSLGKRMSAPASDAA